MNGFGDLNMNISLIQAILIFICSLKEFYELAEDFP